VTLMHEEELPNSWQTLPSYKNEMAL
jgi:hypothetical protein